MYRQMINAFALSQITMVPDIPAVDLATGADEVMGSLPVLVPTDYKPVQQRLFIPTGSEVPFEKMHLDGTNASLDIDDFPNDSGFFGDWLNGGY